MTVKPASVLAAAAVLSLAGGQATAAPQPPILGERPAPGGGRSAETFADNPLYGQAHGPLAIRDGRSYNLIFLQFNPEAPDATPARKTAYDLHLDLHSIRLATAANVRPIVTEIHEVQRLNFTTRWGLQGGRELALGVPIVYRNGGIMPGIIDAWHRIWGMTGNADAPDNRSRYPNYVSIFRLTDAAGNTIVNQGNAFGIGDVSLFLKQRLSREGSRTALAARLGLKLPTGNAMQILGSGAPDLGATLDARFALGREVYAYAGLGEVWMLPATKLPTARRLMTQYSAGIEYAPNARDSFYLQLDGSSLPVRTGNAFLDGDQTALSFGYKRVLDRHLLLSASFSENGDYTGYMTPLLGNIGPDFSVGFGLEWKP